MATIYPTDMPTISDARHTHSTYGLGAGGLASLSVGSVNFGQAANLGQQFLQMATTASAQSAQAAAILRQTKKVEPKKEDTMTRRLVQVFIADPDENVPLDQSLLYSGEQKLTDSTDEELFFEIDIKTVLAAHNEKRTAIVNKKIKERTEYLEPAKIRQLKMVVVNVASF